MILNQGVLFVQLQRFDEAIEDCTRAIELNDGYMKAYMRRAKW